MWLKTPTFVVFVSFVVQTACAPRLPVKVDFTCITHQDRHGQIVSYCADPETWREWEAGKVRESRQPS